VQLKYNFANLISREFLLESNTSKRCLASKTITLQGWINKLQIAAKRSFTRRWCWIGPGNAHFLSWGWMSDQMDSKWAAK